MQFSQNQSSKPQKTYYQDLMYIFLFMIKYMYMLVLLAPLCSSILVWGI